MKSLVLAAALVGAAAAAHAEPATYAVDPTHTFVFYEIQHFGTSTNRGRFPVKEGSVQIDRAAKTGSASITVDIEPQTGVAALDKHLASGDFFLASEFPTATFVADKFTFDGNKVSGLSGSLTIRGKTNPVTLKALHFNCYENPMFKREVCGGDFDTVVKRSQWGVNWGLTFGFPDDVRLIAQIEAIKQ